jgi:hypothetical protein
MTQLMREIAIVRDGSQDPARRAFAAAVLAADDGAEPEPRAPDAAQRMFAFGTRHDAAPVWDSRGPRSGTLTYVDDERVEQYVGPQRWISYRRSDLGQFPAAVGDQVRISTRGAVPVVEAIGPNRLEESTSSVVREVRSGLVVFRTTPIEAAEVESSAQAVAERYGAESRADADTVQLDFRSSAGLIVAPAGPETDATARAEALFAQPLPGIRRLEVCVRSNRLEAALDAERALMLLAAMLVSEADGIAVDDTGAIFSADALALLGSRNQMRADAFDFVAAAARRRWPAEPAWLSEREGVCDELTVCYAQPWRDDFAARFLERELTGLTDGAAFNGDPVVPTSGELFASDEHVESGSFRRLAALRYETVEIEIGFIDVRESGADARPSLAARKDIEALLGRPVASAVVIAFGNRGSETESDRFRLEMCRAETLATTLAASFAARGEALATDVRGVLYSAAELLPLALRRCGKSAAWSARAAAFG